MSTAHKSGTKTRDDSRDLPQGGTTMNRPLMTLVAMESRLFRRDTGAVITGLIFPTLLLVALGSFFPGFLDPSDDFGGERAIDLYTPIVLVTGITAVAVTILPVALATYRERGVLRRLSTTPLPAHRLLVAQLIVQVVVATLGAALAGAAVMVLFDVGAPAAPGWFALSFILATSALFGIGLLAGAVARTASIAQGIGLGLLFPSMFFAGIYFPREVMPDGLRRISDLTPPGAAVQAIRDTWEGSAPAFSNLAVLAVFGVITIALAAKLFRWE